MHSVHRRHCRGIRNGLAAFAKPFAHEGHFVGLRCVDAVSGDEFNETTEKPINRIQLDGQASQQDPPEVGSRIAVKGKLFGAHTGWHVEPVLIDAESLTPRSTN